MSFKRFLALSASAGSGKTYALSIRYIALLFLGEDPNSILAATFTKKAANEMKQRIIKFLKNLHNDSSLVKAISKESGILEKTILKNRKRVLKKFLQSRTHIITLDSFFTYILRSNALEVGLDIDFKIKDNLYEDIEKSLINNLDFNSKLKELVNLALALNKRKSKDINSFFEMIFSIEPILPQEAYSQTDLKKIKKDIISLKNNILEELRDLDAGKMALSNFSEIEFKKFITKPLFEKKSLLEHRNYKKLVQKNSNIDTLFKKLKKMIALYHIALEQNILYYLFDLYNSYKEVRLGNKSELDFNDILYYTHLLISKEITKDFLYFKLDSKFSHILLDEFQDTSILQFLIFQPLIEEIISGVGIKEFRSFFYVGDKKQSLYRFRGGVEELFNYVAKKYNIEIDNLDKNYRSSKLIVNYTNRWFEKKINDFTPQIAVNSFDGYVKVVSSDEIIKSVIKEVEFLTKNGVKSEDIALLVFTNKDGLILQEELIKNGFKTTLLTNSYLKYNPKIAALVGVIEYFLTKQRIYLEPFLQKVGKKQIDLSFLRVDLEPYIALDKIIRNNGYFENDLDILKLLDFAKDYSNIVEFVKEFKRANIDRSKKEESGIKILTIHGSKGLEFKYSIVVDRLKKKSYNKDLLLFMNKDVINIKKIFYRASKKENFIKEYKKALEYEKKLSFKDELNLLYVALTRAEDGLIIIKKDKNSEFEKLELNDFTDGEIIKSKETKKQSPKKIEYKLLSYGTQEIVENNLNNKIADIKDYNAIVFGEALHYVLEMCDLKKLDCSFVKDIISNKYGDILAKDEIIDIKNRVLRLSNNSFFKKLLEKGEIIKEQPIIFEENFYQLDLLIKKNKTFYIVDYKSSEHFKSKHINQVKKYKEALKKIFNKKNIRGFIVYVLKEEDKFIEV